MFRQAPILLLLLGIGACSRSEAVVLPDPILRLESLLLAPPAIPLGDWLLVGRYEVTREEFGLAADPRGANLPVVMVSYEEAASWSEERGLRLPTFEEWQYLASDSGTLTTMSANSRNGLALDLGHPLSVGVFERGRTSLGAYDFYGNVREWVHDPEANRFYACGGSYASRDASSFEWEQLQVEPSERAADVGFRYLADATAYFLNQVLPSWDQLDPEQREQMERILSGWREPSRMALGLRLGMAGAPQDFCDFISGS